MSTLSTRPVNRHGRGLTAVLRAALVAVAVVIALGASGALGTDAVSAQQLGPDDLPITTVYNEFYPEDRDLSDCLSVLPRPGCGSSARSGWPQLTVFGLIVIGVGAVAARVLVSARRTRAALTASGTPAERSATDETTAP
jgi:hypothetical protein